MKLEREARYTVHSKELCTLQMGNTRGPRRLVWLKLPSGTNRRERDSGMRGGRRGILGVALRGGGSRLLKCIFVW